MSGKVEAQSIAGTREQANVIAKRYREEYGKSSVVKKKTSASLMKSAPGRYNRYFYIVTGSRR